MELYAGLDLHSRNTYIGIMDKGFNHFLLHIKNFSTAAARTGTGGFVRR